MPTQPNEGFYLSIDRSCQATLKDAVVNDTVICYKDSNVNCVMCELSIFKMAKIYWQPLANKLASLFLRLAS